jgi:hypothetical protein
VIEDEGVRRFLDTLITRILYHDELFPDYRSDFM